MSEDTNRYEVDSKWGPNHDVPIIIPYRDRSPFPQGSTTSTDSLYLRIKKRRESASPGRYSSADQKLNRRARSIVESERLMPNEIRRERSRGFPFVSRRIMEEGYDSSSSVYGRDHQPSRQDRGTRNHGSIYDLGTESDEEIQHNFARTSIPPEWRVSEHKFPDGSVTQLLSIHLAEHKRFRDKKEKIILACPDQEKSSIKLRWLYVDGAKKL